MKGDSPACRDMHARFCLTFFPHLLCEACRVVVVTPRIVPPLPRPAFLSTVDPEKGIEFV